MTWVSNSASPLGGDRSAAWQVSGTASEISVSEVIVIVQKGDRTVAIGCADVGSVNPPTVQHYDGWPPKGEQLTVATTPPRPSVFVDSR